MKVILMEKVDRLGEPGQQVEVADGYARNFLLPRKLAVEATAGAIKSLGQLKAQAKNREDRVREEAEALAQRITGLEVTLKRRASEETVAVPVAAAASAAPEAAPAPEVPPAPASEGQAEAVPPQAPAPAVERVPRLFGSVTGQDLAEALAAQGIAVDKKKIVLDEPIKTLGRHTIKVRLHAEVSAEFALLVERED